MKITTTYTGIDKVKYEMSKFDVLKAITEYYKIMLGPDFDYSFDTFDDGETFELIVRHENGKRNGKEDQE